MRVTTLGFFSTHRLRDPAIALRFFAALVITVWYSVAPAKPVSIEDLFAVSDYLDVAISPDGKHYLEHIQRGDQTSVAIRRSADSSLTHTFKPEPLLHFNRLLWLNEDRVLAQIAYRGTKEPTRLPSSMMLTTNIDGSSTKFMKPIRRMVRRDKAVEFPGRKEIGTYQLLSKLPSDTQYVRAVKYEWTQNQNSWVDARKLRPTVGLINTYFGTFSDKEKLPYVGAIPYANKVGEVTLISWRDDQNTLRLAKRSSPDDDWRVLSETDKIGASKLEVAEVNRDTSIVYLKGVRNDDQVRTLYAMSTNTGDYLPVFAHQEDLASWATDANNDIVIAAVDPLAGRYLYSKLKPQSPYIDIHRKLVQTFAGKHVSIVSSDDAQQNVIVRTLSDIDPGTYYLFNNQSNEARFIGANRPWLSPEDLIKGHGLKIPTEETSLSIYLNKPKSTTQSRGVVVYMTPDPALFQPQVQALVQQGFTVLQPDTSDSNITESLLAAGQWAIDAKLSAADQICVVGVGTYVEKVIAAALAKPATYHCMIGISGLTALEPRREAIKAMKMHEQTSSPTWLFIEGSDKATATFKSITKSVAGTSVELMLEDVIGDLHDKLDRKAQAAAYSEVLRFLESEFSNHTD